MWNKGEGVVLKFGGSSVATPERIRSAARRAASFARQGRRTAVVVSAMGKATDDLLELARKTVQAKSDRRELDRLLATGEEQSAALFAMALSAEGRPARSFCVRLTGRSVAVDEKLSCVSVIGPGAGNHPEVCGIMLGILADLGATVHLLTSSALSVSCVVDRDRSDAAVRALHEEFIGKKGVFQCA